MRRVHVLRPGLGEPGEETADHVLLAEREEPVQKTALCHDLDAAGVQPLGTGLPGRLRLLLQYEHPYAVKA